MLRLDPDSTTPPYEQIRSQIVEQARDGTLAAGTRLPTVRRLAGELGIAPNTVARAYRELEHAGVIETRGRHGTFIGATDAATAEAASAAREFAQRLRALGVPAPEGLELARAALQNELEGSGNGTD